MPMWSTRPLNSCDAVPQSLGAGDGQQSVLLAMGAVVGRRDVELHPAVVLDEEHLDGLRCGLQGGAWSEIARCRPGPAARRPIGSGTP
ncbi:hypothetical protein [Streptomyces sp. NPDC059076]|uniref:hypothetical protein n=1 Tax=unclassified Streptomyces TaxID=2593676 RepID=UPI0036C8C8C7